MVYGFIALALLFGTKNSHAGVFPCETQINNALSVIQKLPLTTEQWYLVGPNSFAPYQTVDFTNFSSKLSTAKIEDTRISDSKDVPDLREEIRSNRRALTATHQRITALDTTIRTLGEQTKAQTSSRDKAELLRQRIRERAEHLDQLASIKKESSALEARMDPLTIIEYVDQQIKISYQGSSLLIDPKDNCKFAFTKQQNLQRKFNNLPAYCQVFATTGTPNQPADSEFCKNKDQQPSTKSIPQK